jgi:hypothetical protein
VRPFRLGFPRKAPVFPQVKVDWNNRALRAECADEALRLNLGELDEPIEKAFAVFGYDPNNPFDWRKLIWHFAFAHFPPARKKGAPKKWNDDRWCKLLSDLGEVKAFRPTASDTELCINVKKRFASRYRTETSRTLRRNLQYARDPSRNGRLAGIRDQFTIRMRDWFIAQTGGSPDALSQMALKLAQKYLESACDRSPAKN